MTGMGFYRKGMGVRGTVTVIQEGDGVPPDPKRARKLYRAAATTTGGTIYVYVPATRKGGRGYVTPVSMGPKVEGLKEARERLDVSRSTKW